MRIVFMGTPEFAVNILQSLIDSEHDVIGVVTQPDRLVGRKRILTAPPIKTLASKYSIPVFQPEKIKLNYQQVINWNPDIIITCAYGQIIPKVLLDYPKYKAINVHASLLPKYRGGAPIHQAIIDGCRETGITIMYMDVKMDEGDIIAQKTINIEETDDVGRLHEKLSIAGANLLMATLPSIVNHTNKSIKQDHREATYAYNIKPEDEKIIWDMLGVQIYNQIRGLNPWPGAYSILDGRRVKFYRSKIIKMPSSGIPGEIIELQKDGIIVKTGDHNCVKLIEVQLEGKKIQTIKEILNGKHPFIIGKKFST